ncbi:hypothetical protein EMIHUDRAFT_104127 [Emiliania huxleyi CCMP1516]|uniref:RNase H type-1 domain-containing protein n=2 Tax=Emiliania huxleyi TaxID=2903 RepID=A0A0D3IMX2_EMIH1|nr:hypothetical protein EMIHUDRAFT_104127 [Emiliania huxleyi CCMP1516]EOD12607.1 hypothetical protein EMIHUDRAFT_104127 [Emiliania huxleyi CCMP1516]|eukprot:XP_005765036.1 hypothetical protein EMIHUDRAFT_104127 [Emiliania huxleyi CCMP1516]
MGHPPRSGSTADGSKVEATWTRRILYTEAVPGAERRQSPQAWSINARELLGILRVVQFYGEQLQGSAVLVEGDNTAAIGAAQNQASTAVSMQETLRRLLETAERWDIELRFVHTPGVLLHRPDQTSRGDPIEEPRVRLAAAEFAAIERLTGRFTEFVGAERRHAAAEVGTHQRQNIETELPET